mmetsp:Transcript_73793/g.175669  ORF Transcript_73793/g.175669 Transcript_73793/m.175669 type:complete len:220 (+) Transcript_73793:4427-5086(+)
MGLLLDTTPSVSTISWEMTAKLSQTSLTSSSLASASPPSAASLGWAPTYVSGSVSRGFALMPVGRHSPGVGATIRRAFIAIITIACIKTWELLALAKVAARQRGRRRRRSKSNALLLFSAFSPAFFCHSSSSCSSASAASSPATASRRSWRARASKLVASRAMSVESDKFSDGISGTVICSRSKYLKREMSCQLNCRAQSSCRRGAARINSTWPMATLS